MNSKTKKQNISLTLHNKASKYQCVHGCHQIFKSKKPKKCIIDLDQYNGIVHLD